MNPFDPLFRRFKPPKSVSDVLPKLREKAAAVAPDAARVQATIQRALASAGLDVHDPNATGVQKTIRDALQQSGLVSPSPGAQSDASTADTPAGPAKPRTWTAPSASPTAAARGTSSGFRYSGAAGARDYTLYVPPGLDASDAAPAPLLVMLHGCTQSPDDFATGTRMNALADAHGVLVAYPSQTARDNGSRCWNWFRREDQQRGSGEPAILAGIVADIAARQRVDPRRVYVAGLSAGAAMAVILGRTYPDVFAAVGAHSGLPFGAAQDVPGAFAAMQGRGTARTAPGANAVAAQRMPTIVLHGSADHTVQAGNGTAIVEDATAGNAATPPLRAGPTETLRVNGREATRTAYVDDAGRVQVEHVVIAGAGHAWSGGDAAGSHTDAQGPDASALILAFCLQHAR